MCHGHRGGYVGRRLRTLYGKRAAIVDHPILFCVELRIVGLHTFTARSVANKKTANGGFFVCGFSVTLSEAFHVVPRGAPNFA